MFYATTLATVENKNVELRRIIEASRSISELIVIFSTLYMTAQSGIPTLIRVGHE